MKRTLSLITLAALLCGCAGRQLTIDDCTRTRILYEDIVAQLEAGNVLSPKDIERAQSWANILTASCGWIATRSTIQGVPIVRPPN